MLHGDAREPEPRGAGSTPSSLAALHPGLIDYHEHHLHAYELLGLEDRRERELEPPLGTSRAALDAYVEGVADSHWRAAGALRARSAGARRRQRPARPLPRDPRAGGARLDDRLRRHVNRRTGRRAGEYFEDVLVARR